MKAVTFLTIVTLLLLVAIVLSWTPAQAASIKVMVIDTGIVTSHPALRKRSIISFDAKDLVYDSMHGTAITSLVMNGPLNEDGSATTPVCDQVQLYICNYKPFDGATGLNGCLDHAIALKLDYINYSSTGGAFIPAEYVRIAAMPQTTMITASGNEGADLTLSPRFPGMYAMMERVHPPLSGLNSLKNVIMVGALTSAGGRWNLSNYGVPMQMEPGVNIRTAYVQAIGTKVLGYGSALVSGTSGATALHTNKLLRQRCEAQK